jgi:hypothetical protein
MLALRIPVLLVCTVPIALVLIPGRADAQVIRACANPAGQIRLIGPGESCRHEETLVTWNVVGPQGPPGPVGPPGPANRVFSGSVNANGTPQETGFTVQHPAATGFYRINFPAGTFSGNAGNFILAAVTPISTTNTWVNFESAIAPIAADGSASFAVQFANGEVLFAFVVAVAIE